MQNKVITVVFCLALLLGSAIPLFSPDQLYSETERRALAQAPEVSLERFFEGQFGQDIESYLADQFPLRNSWIAVKTLAELATGRRESGGVYFAKDGYLIDQFREYKEAQFDTNLAAVKSLSQRLKARFGLDVKVMLVPTAEEILAEKLPAFAPHISQAALLERARARGLDVVDVSGALLAHRDEYIYYKTDHHFTSLGAYYCYAAWKMARGQTPEPVEAWQREVLCDNFRGTTYAKVNDPFAPWDTITAYYKNKAHAVSYNGGAYVSHSIYERKYLAGPDQYSVFFNANQATAEIHGEGKGRLLLLKDSYANSFAQFVIDEYETTHMIDLRYFQGSVEDYIAKNGITEVLVLYNIPNFAGDMGIMKLASQEGR